MQFFSEGDKSKAICSNCKGVRTTIFAYRDVPFSDGDGIVKSILVGVCEQCDNVASIPAQSTPAISKARHKLSESVEAMLPAPYLDLLDLACFKIDPEASLDLRKGLLMYYVHQFAVGSFDLNRLKKSSEKLALRPAMESKIRRRLSIKTSSRMVMEMANVAKSSSMQKTATIKAIIGAIQEDIVNEGSPELIRNIRDYAILATA
jgi:hypothetical protein